VRAPCVAARARPTGRAHSLARRCWCLRRPSPPVPTRPPSPGLRRPLCLFARTLFLCTRAVYFSNPDSSPASGTFAVAKPQPRSCPGTNPLPSPPPWRHSCMLPLHLATIVLSAPLPLHLGRPLSILDPLLSATPPRPPALALLTHRRHHAVRGVHRRSRLFSHLQADPPLASGGRRPRLAPRPRRLGAHPDRVPRGRPRVCDQLPARRLLVRGGGAGAPAARTAGARTETQAAGTRGGGGSDGHRRHRQGPWGGCLGR